MDRDPVRVDISDGIATVTIDRPQVMNALAADTIRSLRKAIAAVRDRDDARAMVLTGSGKAFCTGADLKDPEMALDGPLDKRSDRLARLMSEDINPLMAELMAFPKPTLAAVNGPAVGGGIGLALSTDIAVATESAYFMQVFTQRLGLVPDMGVTWHLERLVGRARARGLALLGNRLPAKQAAEWGLIWQCVPDEAFAGTVATVARQIADAPPLAVRSLRGIMDEAPLRTFPAQLDIERDTQCDLVATADAQEAILAFREKRQPRFTGR